MTEPQIGATASRTVQALSATASALVEPYDVVGVTSRLVLGAARATGAAAGGLILRRAGEARLGGLGATSHRAEHIELFQVQVEQGPCFDAVETAQPTTASSVQEIRARWPALADRFAGAGYRSAHATPLHWNGNTIGALNLFWPLENRDTQPVHDVAKTFADMATLAVVHAGSIPDTVLEQRTRDALDERTVIEQAKGVLVYQHHIPLEEAFTMLLTLAGRNNELLTRTAARIVEQATAGRVSDVLSG